MLNECKLARICQICYRSTGIDMECTCTLAHKENLTHQDISVKQNLICTKRTLLLDRPQLLADSLRSRKTAQLCALRLCPLPTKSRGNLQESHVRNHSISPFFLLISTCGLPLENEKSIWIFEGISAFNLERYDFEYTCTVLWTYPLDGNTTRLRPVHIPRSRSHSHWRCF